MTPKLVPTNVKKNKRIDQEDPLLALLSWQSLPARCSAHIFMIIIIP